GQPHHDGLRNRLLCEVVAKRAQIGRQQVRGQRRYQAERGVERCNRRQRDWEADGRLLGVEVEEGNLVFLLIEGETQALYVGVGIHVAAESRLHRTNLDLWAPVGLADAGCRAGIDIEHVAGLLREVVDVFQISALLTGNLVDGQRNEQQ